MTSHCYSSGWSCWCSCLGPLLEYLSHPVYHDPGRQHSLYGSKHCERRNLNLTGLLVLVQDRTAIQEWINDHESKPSPASYLSGSCRHDANPSRGTGSNVPVFIA